MNNLLADYAIGSTVFGDWKIVEDLGSGSYGTVYKIEKAEYGIVTHSALKVIRVPKNQSEIRDVLGDGMDEKSVTSYFQGMVDSLVREIAVMSTLKSHPNIVAYENHKVTAHPGTIGWDILIQMELLTSLRDYQKAHPMTEADVRRLAVDMCNALVFCQKKALIHRDIKPQNIFVSEAGQFKLGDFGVARTMDKTVGSLSKQGTEDYMAPEVYKGQKYGPNVDIYSLGLVLYRLMNNNRLPFMPPAPQPIGFGDRLNALTDRIGGEKLMVPPCNASPEFARIILNACAHDPKDRYQTAAEMLEALNGLSKTKDLKEEPEEEPVNDGREDDEEEGESTLGPFSHPRDDPPEEEESETLGPFRDRKNPVPSEEPEPPEPAPAKKSVLPKVIAGVAAAGVVAAVILAVVLGNGDQKPSNSPSPQNPAISAGQETTEEHDPETEEKASVEKYTNEDGTVTEDYYDADGNLTKEVLYSSANGLTLRVTEYTAGIGGSPVKESETSYSHKADGTVSGWSEWFYNSDEVPILCYRYAADGSLEYWKQREYEYASDGTLGRWYEYTYDAEDRLWTEVWEYGTIGYELREYFYTYDAEGTQHCIEQHDYSYDDNWHLENYTVWKNDENGIAVSREEYSANDKLQNYSEYTNDSDGKVIREDYYDGDGNWKYWREYRYDENGKWTGCIEHYSED